MVAVIRRSMEHRAGVPDAHLFLGRRLALEEVGEEGRSPRIPGGGLGGLGSLRHGERGLLLSGRAHRPPGASHSAVGVPSPRTPV